MNNVHNKRTAVPFINVTPLIDVLLVLLIIFMIISPIKPSSFAAKIPEKPRDPGDAIFCGGYTLVVTINRGGGYALNRESFSALDALQARLRDALDGRPDDRKTVFLKAPRTLPYGEVVKVIDVMKASGSAPIGLQTEALDQ